MLPTTGGGTPLLVVGTGTLLVPGDFIIRVMISSEQLNEVVLAEAALATDRGPACKSGFSSPWTELSNSQ